jgi:hypothetical protein
MTLIFSHIIRSNITIMLCKHCRGVVHVGKFAHIVWLRLCYSSLSLQVKVADWIYAKNRSFLILTIWLKIEAARKYISENIPYWLFSRLSKCLGTAS